MGKSRKSFQSPKHVHLKLLFGGVVVALIVVMLAVIWLSQQKNLLSTKAAGCDFNQLKTQQQLVQTLTASYNYNCKTRNRQTNRLSNECQSMLTELQQAKLKLQSLSDICHGETPPSGYKCNKTDAQHPTFDSNCAGDEFGPAHCNAAGYCELTFNCNRPDSTGKQYDQLCSSGYKCNFSTGNCDPIAPTRVPNANVDCIPTTHKNRACGTWQDGEQQGTQSCTYFYDGSRCVYNNCGPCKE